MKRLQDKVAIITGAAQGMGAAHARMFVAEGARVVMTDVLDETGAALSKELGDNAIFIRHDVTKWDEWRSIVDACRSEFGAPTVLVNNAGVLGPIVGTVDFEIEAYESVCAVNQTGVFLGMKAVIPSMLESGGGSIVNVSSIAGLASVYGSPNLAYVCSKFAVRGMTKFVAVEQGKHNIRVNSVHPGAIMTPMVEEALGGPDSAAARGFRSQVPMDRFAEPSEVSRLMVFLASDESAYVTGTEHVIDGGMTAQ